MRGYFHTRRTVLVIAVAVLINAGMLLIARPMVTHHDSGVVVFTPATPLQILVVGALSLGLSGRSEQFESVGVRPLWLLRLLNAGLLVVTGGFAATAVSLLYAGADVDPGTVGTLAPLRAVLGLMGIALVVATFADMRLGALCALPFVILPGAFDLRGGVGGDVLGFVLADAESRQGWISAIVLGGVGVGLFAFAYSRRSSPSADRRALLDSRARRRGTG